MYNIKQKTNFDIKNLESHIKTVTIAGVEKQISYKTIIFSNAEKVIKIGYCCEPRGIGVPIFLKINNNSTNFPIYIGKTGMFETQPDTWKNINDEEAKEEEYKILINEIEVPYKIEENNFEINFKLDYVVDQ